MQGCRYSAAARDSNRTSKCTKVRRALVSGARGIVLSWGRGAGQGHRRLACRGPWPPAGRGVGAHMHMRPRAPGMRAGGGACWHRPGSRMRANGNRKAGAGLSEIGAAPVARGCGGKCLPVRCCWRLDRRCVHHDHPSRLRGNRPRGVKRFSHDHTEVHVRI